MAITDLQQNMTSTFSAIVTSTTELVTTSTGTTVPTKEGTTGKHYHILYNYILSTIIIQPLLLLAVLLLQ